MRFEKTAITAILACFAAPCLHADFSYEQSTKITGGAMVGMMKFAGALSKDARKAMEPTKSTTAVQGNRMVHKMPDSASIIDLQKETITTVNYAKKTYSVATFAQIKQAMDEMSQKMREQKDKATERNPSATGQDQNVDMHFDVKVNDTGQSKVINGNNAHEMIMTITMSGADPKSGAKGGLDVTTDMWVAPQVSGYEQVRDFYRRMSEKLEWTPGANPILMSRPDMARAMAQLYKEGSKLDGMPVYEVIKMGAKVEGAPNASTSQPDSGSQSQPAAQSQSTQEAPPPASVRDALGAALGSRFGGFGHKKKKSSDDSSSSSSTSAPPANSGSSSSSGSLIEMTTEVLNYSAGPTDPSLFEVPSGFSQVQDAMPSRSSRK